MIGIACGFVGVTLFATPLSPCSIQLLGGVDDSVAGDVDPASPSPELAAVVGTTADFDGTMANSNTAHTFVGLPPNITGATLEFQVRGFQGGAFSDGLILSFFDPQTVASVDAIAWARTFGTLMAADPSS